MQIRTQAVHFSADQKLIDYIEKKILKLDHFFDGIIEAHVTLKLESHGRIKDKVAEVRLSIPGPDIFYCTSSKKFETAIDQCVRALKIQVNKHKEKLRQ